MLLRQVLVIEHPLPGPEDLQKYRETYGLDFQAVSFDQLVRPRAEVALVCDLRHLDELRPRHEGIIVAIGVASAWPARLACSATEFCTRHDFDEIAWRLAKYRKGSSLVLSWGQLSWSADRRTMWLDGHKLDLSRQACTILRLLVMNAGECVSIATFKQAGACSNSRVLAVQVWRIRRQIAACPGMAGLEVIRCFRHEGYRLDP